MGDLLILHLRVWPFDCSGLQGLGSFSGDSVSNTGVFGGGLVE